MAAPSLTHVLSATLLQPKSIDKNFRDLLSAITDGTKDITVGTLTSIGAISGSNLSGTNTGDVTIGTANGLSLAGQVLSLAAAAAGAAGAVTTGTQTLAGAKTLTGLTTIGATAGMGTGAAPYHIIYGSILNGVTSTNRTASLVASDGAYLLANVYLDGAGAEKAIRSITGYAKLQVVQRSTSSAPVFNLIVNYQDAQTADSALVTTNEVTVLTFTGAGVPTFSSPPGFKAGAGTSIAKPGGAIFDHFADAGNVTTGETDLYSDSIAANTLNTNGNKIYAQYGGTFVSSATATRDVRVYFAGTSLLDTGALSISTSASWGVSLLLIRVSATVVRYTVSLQTSGASTAIYNATGELTGLTLTNANTLKITGQAGGVGAATNDIVAKLGAIYFESAA